MGHLFGNNADRGIYKTNNGGKTWEKVLYINETTGGIDLAMDPNNPNRIYAAMWERVRRPHFRKYHGLGSGIYKTEDGASNWSKLSKDLPTGELGRIGLAIAPSKAERIYSVISNASGAYEGLYISDDFGESWSRKTISGIANVPYMWWFGKITVDPSDPEKLFSIGFNMDASSNSGTSWSGIFNGAHVDQHALYIHPADPEFMIAGNDGGICISENGGLSYVFQQTLPITQFYTCEIDTQAPDRLYGGTQDNGTNRTFGEVDNWQHILGGDGFYALVDPVDNKYVYAESQYGNFKRSTNGGSSFSFATVGIANERTNWNTPVVFDPSQTSTLYYGAQRLYQSINRAQNWDPISPDLTKGSAGGNLSFGTITTIAVSEQNGNIIYAGTDDGNVWNTLDGGNNWTKLSEDLPNRWVTRVACDPFIASSAIVTFSGFRFNESDGNVFITNDNGNTWLDISSNLPQVPINDIVYDPQNQDWFYLATDLGVFYTLNEGLTWEILGMKLPNVPVTDIDVHKQTRVLVAATYGRSMYSYDLSEFTSIDAVTSKDFDISAFPNPFTEFITISFDLDTNSMVNLIVYDLLGRKVDVLCDEVLSSGNQQFKWGGRTKEKGIYFIVVKIDEYHFTQKIQLI